MESAIRISCVHASPARVDRAARGVLFEHDVALDGRSGLILAGFYDPVIARSAWTEHFDDDDGVLNDSGGSVDRGADDHAVGITDVAIRDLKFEVAAEELAGRAKEAARQGEGEISLDDGVAKCPAGHGDGSDAVKFVAQGLPFLPFEEFGKRHGFVQGKVHGSLCYHELGVDATERDRRGGGSASTGAKGGLDVADREVERREPRSRRQSGRGA